MCLSNVFLYLKNRWQILQQCGRSSVWTLLWCSFNILGKRNLFLQTGHSWGLFLAIVLLIFSSLSTSVLTSRSFSIPTALVTDVFVSRMPSFVLSLVLLSVPTSSDDVTHHTKGRGGAYFLRFAPTPSSMPGLKSASIKHAPSDYKLINYY